MKDNEIDGHWRRIINTMNEGVMLVGQDGTVLMVNLAFENLTGFSASEVVGKPCTMLHCDACEKLLSKTENCWCTLFDEHHGDLQRCRCSIIRKDGSCLPALKNASVLKDENGKVLGAVETITDLSEIERLDQEVVQLSRQLGDAYGFYGIIGKSTVMQNVFDVIQKAALSDSPVIIYGESGTGKELVARAVHELGKRKHGPYIQLNCAAISESLLESELFGHIKGAFTGAYRHKIGRFEAADGGDLFLDEVGDMSLPIQAKLLRILETKRFERVGDHKSLSVDVRIITATNQNLDRLIEEKKFRDDLFYRINVIPIHLPPLRERKEDIPLLVNAFVERLSARTSKPIKGLNHDVLEMFLAYDWPGNIRELKSVLEYAFVIAEESPIQANHLPPQFQQTPRTAKFSGQPGINTAGDEKTALVEALRLSQGNQSKAAQLLGVTRITVWRRMKKYGIQAQR